MALLPIDIDCSNFSDIENAIEKLAGHDPSGCSAGSGKQPGNLFHASSGIVH